MEPGEVLVLVVRVAGQRLGLPLESVGEVLPAVATEPLPTAPEVVRGLVNVRGDLLPLLDVRSRLRHPPIPMHPDHHLVTCTVADRTVALHVDRAESVGRVETGKLTPAQELPATEHLSGVAVSDEGLLVVYDVRSFLGADEVLQLDAALSRQREHR